MLIFERYLFRSILGPICAILLIITIIIWVTQALKFIDFAVNTGIDLSTFLYVSILILPPLVSLILPIGLYLGIIYGLNKLYNNSELIVFRASGVSRLDLAKPILFIALIACIINYFITLYFLPLSNQEFHKKVNNYKNNHIAVLLQEKVFIHPVENLTLYISEMKENILKDVFLFDLRKQDNPIKITAKEGEFSKRGDQLILNLKDGNRQETNDKDEPSVLYFDFMSFDFDIKSDLLANKSFGIKESFIGELLFPKGNFSNDELIRMKVEAHFRIIWPITNILLSVIALRSMLAGKFSRKGKSKSILIFSLLAASVIMVTIGVISLANKLYSLIYILYISIFYMIYYFYRTLKTS